MSFDPSQLADKFFIHGTEWADANAAADSLEESLKALKSQIALKFLPNAGSVAKAEMMALASDEYSEYIKSMVEARKKANRAKVLFDCDKIYIEMVRSQESTRRAEMNLR